MVARLIISVCLLLIPSVCLGKDFWNWSPDGQHHNAAVVVSVPNPDGDGSFSGSGVYVSHKGTVGVLTAAHIIKMGQADKATVKFRTGEEKTGKSTVDKYGYDIGFVWVRSSGTKLKPLIISPRPPGSNDRVEFVTFGGPGSDKAKNTLRHFYGAVWKKENCRQWYDARVISGDSGGAILNDSRQVVGIQSSGSNEYDHLTADNGTRWRVYRRGASAPFSSIRSFMDRVHTKTANCPDGQCYPRGSVAPSSPGSNRRFYPNGGASIRQSPKFRVIPKQKLPSTYPESPPKKSGGQCRLQLDYNKLADIVIQRMEENPDVFRGPKGDAGPPGKDGQTPDVSIDYQRLSEMVVSRMKQNPDQFRGPKGADGQTPEIDYQQLTDSVKSRLPGFRVIRKGRDGEIIHTEDVELGGDIVFPPVRMEVQHTNGDVFFQEKPLGGTIAIELVD